MVRNGLPRHASTVYIWPTETCSIGCAHCNFASPLLSRRAGYRRVAERPIEVARFVDEMTPWKVAFSGGGEPLDESQAVFEMISAFTAREIHEVEVITGGNFGGSADQAESMFADLLGAWSRSSVSSHASLKLRLSIDSYHVHQLGIENYTRILHAYEAIVRPGILDMYIRSVVESDDDHFGQVARAMGAEVIDQDRYHSVLRLISGTEIPIYRKNLILDGRLGGRRGRAARETLPDASLISEFGATLSLHDGQHVPARTYNGPSPTMLDGLACVIENQGSLKVLEGNSPDRVPNIFERSWNEALDFLYRDPITHFLVERGPFALDELLEGSGAPAARQVASQTNQLYYIVDRVLADARHRSLATIGALRTLGAVLDS